jgi:hypothetical protein
MIDLNKFNSELYTINHLSDQYSSKIKTFMVKDYRGGGLENYLKYMALNDEKFGMARTYIIETTDTKEIAAYFTLRSGLITASRGLFRGFDTYTGIELANFAVNDAYREANDVIPKLGSHLFYVFIFPLVQEISKYLGSAYLYIYALPEDKLMAHYQTMGFERTTLSMEKHVYRHVKPAYDKGCCFMYQKI